MPAVLADTNALRRSSQPASSGLTVPVYPSGSMAYQFAYPPGFDASKVSTAMPSSTLPAVSGSAPPGAVPLFPIHPAAMYGQMQQMQQQLQAVQQQMSSGVGPLTNAQQAELSRARLRGQRAAAAKQKLVKQREALAAKRAKAAASKAEPDAKKRKTVSDRKNDDDGGDDDSEGGGESGGATRVGTGGATAADIQGIEAMDVSALAAMSPDDQLKEIQKRLVGVECVKEQKRLKRLLRNRVSAQQARERKKNYVSTLEDKSREQENEIQQLQQKVQSLKQENQMLRQVVKNMRMQDK